MHTIQERAKGAPLTPWHPFLQTGDCGLKRHLRGQHRADTCTVLSRTNVFRNTADIKIIKWNRFSSLLIVKQSKFLVVTPGSPPHSKSASCVHTGGWARPGRWTLGGRGIPAHSAGSELVYRRAGTCHPEVRAHTCLPAHMVTFM